MPFTKKPRHQPAIQHAYDFVEEGLANGIWKAGECLPPIRRLAAMASVSKATMLKAIALLAEKGMVSSIERFRIRAGAGNIPAAPPSEIRLHRQKIRSVFERELLSGIFGFDRSIPSVKELQGRYGVSFVTMKRIISAMVSDGLLEPYGRGYRYPEIHHRAVRPRIVFITLQGHLAQISALNSGHNQITNLFENEIKRRGIFMEIVEVDFFDASAARRMVSRLVNSDSIVGYILDVWWYEGKQYRDGYLSVLNRCATFKKPIVLLDELGEFQLPIQLSKNPRIQVFAIETRGSGSRMARFLMELGHRGCVYLSPFHGTAWSRERYAGIVEQFSRIGGENRVHLVTDETGDSFMYLLMMSGLTEEEIHRVLTMGRTPAQSERLKAQWTSLAGSAIPHLLANPDDQMELRRSLSSLQVLMRSNLPEAILARLCSEAIDIGANCFGTLSLKRSFERALGVHGATAWICANDSIAFGALSFLREHDIRVPRELSVVGFDNLPVKSLEQQLTTYDFNAVGFVNQMLSFILRPPRPRGQYRHKTIEVEGIVMERGSAAPVRR
jgi:DNA-binding LacI/PurR family transcriptional regulator/DNA-binding transcriptional regulator YhcF (GntR family)